MTKIESLDRATVRHLADIVEKAVREALAPFGLNVRLKGGSFTQANYTMRIEASVVAPNGEAQNQRG